MDIRSIIKKIAEAENVTYEEAEKMLDDTWNEIRSKTNNKIL